MVRVRGGRPASLREWEDETMRGHIKSVTGGKTNLTIQQVVELLRSGLPHLYSRRDRNLIFSRVARITISPLSGRRAAENPTTSQLAKKRRKRIEARNVIEVSSASASGRSSDSDGREPDQSEGDEIDDGDEVETKEDGESSDVIDDDNKVEANEDGGSSDVNGVNREILGDLGEKDELGYGRREMDDRPIFGDLGGKDELGYGRREIDRPIFGDLGGMDRLLEELKREIITQLHQLKVLRHLGVEPTARILLHGPPGCGKTTLARAIANEAGVPLYEISAAAGAPEENIRELFSKAYMRAPSVVFIDEIDAVNSKTESLQKATKLCAVKQLMACMDELNRPIKPLNHKTDSESSNSRPGCVLMIGATNMPDALDRALRRRFDREINLRVPEDDARLGILSALTRNLKVEVGLDLEKLARCTVGFVAGDLVALVKKASMLAVDRIMDKRVSEAYKEQRVGVRSKDCYRQMFSEEDLENLDITMGHFMDALKMVQPSTKVEGFSTTPRAKWDDVGGLQLLKLEFEHHVVKHIKFPELYKGPQLNLFTSFFLCGPSGCGKTLIIEALANEARANFLRIKACELLKFGDEVGLFVRNIFNYARAHTPFIVFFDELDVAAPCGDEDERQWPNFRQVISEFSNAEESMRGVYVIGATSRHIGEREMTSHFSFIQKQFDRILYVPPPSAEERGVILKALARHKPIDADVDLMALGKDVACENFSGSDLSALMRGAAVAAIDRPTLSGGSHGVPLTIRDADFKSALAKISPSLSSTQVKFWELLAKKIVVDGSSEMGSCTVARKRKQ